MTFCVTVVNILEFRVKMVINVLVSLFSNRKNLMKSFFTVSGNEPNTSSHSQDPLLIPTPSPVSPRHCFGQVPGGTHSSSSEDVQADSVANGGSLGHSYARKKKLVQHLSGSLSRAFKRGRNRKSLDISKLRPLRVAPHDAV